MNFSAGPDALPLMLGFSVAAGGGLLIGLERERRKGRGPDREAAGIRSFTLVAIGGALAQGLGESLLVACGALGVIALAAAGYLRTRSRDPGLTTELAMVVTYLVGVLSMSRPLLGAGAAVVVASLLTARDRLHYFATRVLSESELHDALLLGALGLVLMPLVPSEPPPWLPGLQPRTLAGLLLLILLLQAAGHVALRLFGPRAGLALSGLFSGFVSSTATVALMGTRARHRPTESAACQSAAMLSTAASWAVAMLMLAVLAPAAARALAPSALAGFAVAMATGLWRARAAPDRGGAPSAHGAPLRPREAALVALLLTGVTLLVGWAQREYGDAGVLVGAAVSALADAHASIAALGALQADSRISPGTGLAGVLVAISANAGTRVVTAFVAGGRRFGARVAVSLVLSTAAAWAATLPTGAWGG